MSEWKCQKLYKDYLNALDRIPNRTGGNYPNPQADAVIRQFERCEALHPKPNKNYEVKK